MTYSEIQASSREVTLGPWRLQGDLVVPPGASGVILFCHGSGSSRFSSRNRWVAAELNRAGLATLLFDLLNEEEAAEDRILGHLRFDIGLLAERVKAATAWLANDPHTAQLPIGYFGASTGTAAAIVAGASSPAGVRAIVSRGGRPDLAGAALGKLAIPILLIVGSLDTHVLSLNQRALARIGAVSRLELVPGASHLFEEPGTLEAAARLAADWFARHLPTHPGA